MSTICRKTSKLEADVAGEKDLEGLGVRFMYRNIEL